MGNKVNLNLKMLTRTCWIIGLMVTASLKGDLFGFYLFYPTCNHL